MAIRKGRCSNFGNCPEVADKDKIVEVSATADFVCPECERPLNEVKTNGISPKLLAGAVVAIAVIAGIIWFFLPDGSKNGSKPLDPTPKIAQKKPLSQIEDLIKPDSDMPSSMQEDLKTLISELEKAKTSSEKEKLIPEVNKLMVEFIRFYLGKAEFAKARDLIRHVAQAPEAKDLIHKIGTPVKADVKCQFRKTGQTPGSLYPVDSAALKNAGRLSNEDKFRCSVSKADDVSVYVIQKTQSGKIRMLNQSSQEWLDFDENVTSEAIRMSMTLYVIAFPWKLRPLDDLEAISDQAVRKRNFDAVLKEIETAKTHDIRSLYYAEGQISYSPVSYILANATVGELDAFRESDIDCQSDKVQEYIRSRVKGMTENLVRIYCPGSNEIYIYRKGMNDYATLLDEFKEDDLPVFVIKK